jgi:hypothetical protein
MIMMDLISVLFGIGRASGMGYPGGKSTGIGFECIAQIGVGLRGEARARNPDCGAIAGHGVWAKIYLRCKAVFGGAGRMPARAA